MACPSLTPEAELTGKFNTNWLDVSARRYERVGEETNAADSAGSAELAPAAAASPSGAYARRRFLRILCPGVLGPV